MIKCSTVDIERLARFVESNVLDPKWITMQIPSGTAAISISRSNEEFLYRDALSC
jgi:hypothetical protein